MTFGAWNVHTILDQDAFSRPERRTALIARELGKYQTDIAALSETKLVEEGSVAEPKEDTHSSGGERQKRKTEYMV